MGLLGSSTLTPSTIPICSKYIDDLVSILRSRSSELSQLSPSLVSYIFFPISSILQRNAPLTIPDQIFEKVFTVLGYLSESWWWHCEAAIWEQIFMLCSSVLGGMASKGKGRERDDEVKEAAAQCLYVLLKERDESQQAKDRLVHFQNYARSPHFIPVLGQTLSATISISESRSLSLQKTSLQILRVLLELYVSDEMFPMVLPGVISSASKVALGSKLEKQWAHGEIVAAALHVMQTAIIKSVGDDICIKEGVLKHADDLEGLAELLAPSAAEFAKAKESSTQFKVARTPSWLKGTTSQLHIAINALDSLTRHPSPVALRALVEFSWHVLEGTPQTLTQTQPLLLAFLLSLSNSNFDSVSCQARSHLLFLLSDENESHIKLSQTLMRLTSEYLSSLPRLISIQEESKVQHLSGLIRAVCDLTILDEDSTIASLSPSATVKGIGKLLGPSSDIEKWGWSLLSVFRFSDVPLPVDRNSTERLMLENNPDGPQAFAFPSLELKSLDVNTLQMLEQMFRSLGAAAGETCLYAIEWFFGIGKSNVGRNAVAAMWCACRLLEGVSGIRLASEENISRLRPNPTKRLEKLARSMARTLSEQCDREIDDFNVLSPSPDTVQDLSDASLVERKTGLYQLHENLKITQSSPASINENVDQPVNHRVLSLQTLSVCVGILQSRSSPLFIHVLYPVLHSLVSQVSFLSSTAYASLQFMTVMTSYASPANLLLSNFDYALDGISRRLTRRWLDVDATQVLALLVHLVGSDVVEKAGDVLEECFDRLDEFHGYDVLVEGLVSVLVEVTRVLGNDASLEVKLEKEPEYTMYPRLLDLSSSLEWYRKRKEVSDDVKGAIDYGPAPRRAWGELKSEMDEQKTREEEEESMANAANPNDEPPPTSIQALTQQMVTRSLYFLTHDSPVIRARIFTLLASSVPNLPSSALMPAIHSAWPFVLNRLGDQETFVVSAAASLIETLSTYNGEFMFRRIWDDVWPKFKILLTKLQAADATSALARRGEGAVGTESSYTHSHRLYRSLLNTMAAVLGDVRPHERSFWDVLLLFRRFLNRNANHELQQCARRLYTAAMSQNGDLVWLVLTATHTREHPVMSFLYNEKWDIVDNARLILGNTSTK